MTGITALFGNSEEKQEEGSEKLHDLYWKRAELKKEFAGLREEKIHLQERIKQQEGATARTRQRLDHLEQLLLDPEWVYNVVIYYQLNGLNKTCQRKLEKFAEQLKQQREQRGYGRMLDGWNEQLQEEAAAVERRIGEHRMKMQMLEDKLQSERYRLTTMNGLVRALKGRSASAAITDLEQTIAAEQHEEESLLMKYDEIQNRTPPDTEGLDIPTKRLINFMIIAFAQQLYLHFSADGLAGMAKEAGDRSVGAINYGGKKECDDIVAKVNKRIESFEKATDFANILQQRAQLIAEKALFRGDDDAVPVSGTVATVFAINEKGDVRTKDANLLGEDYWGLSSIVSR